MAANEMAIAWSGNGSAEPVGGSASIGVAGRDLGPSEERALIERAQGGDRKHLKSWCIAMIAMSCDWP